MIGFLVLLGFGGIAWLVIGGAAKLEHDQKKAEQNADVTLDAAFDGRENVSFTINARSLKYDTVVIGAKERGYKLLHQAENQYGPHTLIFEKDPALAN